MSDQYPHKCPLCQYPAYLGLNTVACTNVWCKHYEAPKFEYPEKADASPQLRQALIKAVDRLGVAAPRVSGIQAWLPSSTDPAILDHLDQLYQDAINQAGIQFYPDDGVCDCDDDDCDASD